LRRAVALGEDLVDQAPVARLLRRHEAVAVERPFDLRAGPAAMFRIEADDPVLRPPRFLGMYQYVGGLALIAAERLVDMQAGIGQRGALAR
jgi:hypothetical protein